METRTTYIAEIVHRLATDLGFVDASGFGASGVLLDPNSDGEHCAEWTPDVIADLVSWDNPKRRITNSDLELAALVVQEATFPLIYTYPS